MPTEKLNQDWTFLNYYRGSFDCAGKYAIESCQSGIPQSRLSMDHKILYYKDLLLYEDDMDDFGYS